LAVSKRTPEEDIHLSQCWIFCEADKPSDDAGLNNSKQKRFQNLLQRAADE
jgi:hypothetical protein